MRCTAALLSRTYVFAAFDGRWPGVTFLILALSGKLALGPVAPGKASKCSLRQTLLNLNLPFTCFTFQHHIRRSGAWDGPWLSHLPQLSCLDGHLAKIKASRFEKLTSFQPVKDQTG